MAELKVEIGAEIKELQGKLNQASKELKGFTNKTDKNLGKFGKASVGAGKDVKNLGKSVVSGNSAMTAFSRTVQDAPFGLMGVSNNITNLTEQFGYLKNKTGSSGGALKAMLRDLKGFGGISLAISVATSLLLVFGDEIFKSRDKVKELKKEQEDLTNSLENYKLGLESVNKARLTGEQSAQKELLTLRLLKSTVEDTTKSTSERKGALKKLRDIYPDYLQNLTDEQALSGSLSIVYDKLTKSILQRAKATAAMNAIIKNSEMLLNLESQLAEKTEALTKEQDRLNKSLANTNKLAGNNPMAGLAKSGAAAASTVNELKKSINELEGQIQGIELANIDLEGNIDLTEALLPRGTTETGIRERVTSIFDSLNTDLLNGIQNINQIQQGEGANILGTTLSKFDADALMLKSKLMQLNEGLTQIIQGGLTNALSGIGEAIGSAMSGASNLASGLGKALLGSLGGMLKQMGVMAIAIGIGLAKIKAALASLNPAVAIAAGVALVALGSFFSSKSASIGGSVGGGGSNASGGGGSTSFSGGSSASFSSGGGGGGTVVFEIKGTKLVGVLSNTLRRNRNLGGSLSLT